MLIDALSAMSNEYRIMILESLKEGRKRPQDMEKITGLTRGGLERHLKLLIDSFLVEKETYVEDGRAKVIYYLGHEAENFLDNLDNLYNEFHKNIVKRKSPDEYKRENIKILSLKINKVNESLEQLEKINQNGEIDDKEYLDLKVKYVNDLIRYQQELSTL